MTSVDITPTRLTAKELESVIQFAKQLQKACKSDEDVESLVQLAIMRTDKQQIASAISKRARVRAAKLIYADLCRQGWILSLKAGRVFGLPPTHEDLERNTRRRRMVIMRDEQLRSPSARDFITKMETGHFHKNARVSIFSCLRDGRDLAKGLEAISSGAAETESVVDPYLQFVQTGKRCAQTGFYLQDIWRYFRHTWSNPYESIPGRTLMFLVRDRASEYHSVIGIGALSSAAVRLEARDQFIGWDTDQFCEQCEKQPTSRVADWAMSITDDAIARIYKSDFVRDEVVPAKWPRDGLKEISARLRLLSAKSKKQHQRLSEGKDNKTVHVDGNANNALWRSQAETYLFRFKRGLELANLLEIKDALVRAYDGESGKGRLVKLLSSGDGKKYFNKIIRVARSASVGSEIADLTVCGAIPPYNEILGGKLVAMMAASPGAVREYHNRYRGAASVIASSMAGRRIVRPNNLVFIGTTSLYGIRPNQYDRASYPAEILGGAKNKKVIYQLISERTEGVGTFQFGAATKKAIKNLVDQETNSSRVNNVFGEGANPRLRALRDGLGYLGLPANHLLKHGIRKLLYGAKLTENLSDYLFGFSKRPRYIFAMSQADKTGKSIGAWWLDRWVRTRITRPEVLDRIRAHSLVRPIRHGGRVVLPASDPNQLDFKSEDRAS